MREASFGLGSEVATTLQLSNRLLPFSTGPVPISLLLASCVYASPLGFFLMGLEHSDLRGFVRI